MSDLLNRIGILLEADGGTEEADPNDTLGTKMLFLLVVGAWLDKYPAVASTKVGQDISRAVKTYAALYAVGLTDFLSFLKTHKVQGIAGYIAQIRNPRSRLNKSPLDVAHAMYQCYQKIAMRASLITEFLGFLEGTTITKPALMALKKGVEGMFDNLPDDAGAHGRVSRSSGMQVIYRSLIPRMRMFVDHLVNFHLPGEVAPATPEVKRPEKPVAPKIVLPPDKFVAGGHAFAYDTEVDGWVSNKDTPQELDVLQVNNGELHDWYPRGSKKWHGQEVWVDGKVDPRLEQSLRRDLARIPFFANIKTFHFIHSSHPLSFAAGGLAFLYDNSSGSWIDDDGRGIVLRNSADLEDEGNIAAPSGMTVAQPWTLQWIDLEDFQPEQTRIERIARDLKKIEFFKDAKVIQLSDDYRLNKIAAEKEEEENRNYELQHKQAQSDRKKAPEQQDRAVRAREVLAQNKSRGGSIERFKYAGEEHPIVQPAVEEAREKAKDVHPSVKKNLASMPYAPDPSQLVAIASTDQKATVIAAAGSGKTATIAARVLNLTKSGVRPDLITVTTFGKLAAKELKDRIIQICGPDIGRRVDVRTTHSLAFGICLKGGHRMSVDSTCDHLKNDAHQEMKTRLKRAEKDGDIVVPEDFWKDGFTRGTVANFIGTRKNSGFTPASAITEYYKFHDEDLLFRSLVGAFILYELGKGTLPESEKTTDLEFLNGKDKFGTHKFPEFAPAGPAHGRKNKDGEYQRDWADQMKYRQVVQTGKFAGKVKKFPFVEFDDMLSKAADLLEDNDYLRQSQRAERRHFIVDEAQDLNPLQHRIFDAMTSTEKGKDPSCGWLVGDPSQCVEETEKIPYLPLKGGKTAQMVPVKELPDIGLVASYENGERKFFPYTKEVSEWSRGLEITLASGKSIKISPNHRVYALNPVQDGYIVYLMFRPDLGFRVGMTSSRCGKFGHRTWAENATRLWIIGMYPTLEEALFQEKWHSLTYGVPQTVFNDRGGGKGPCDQAFISRLFAEFGQKGYELLRQRDLSFDYPHWFNQGSSVERRVRLFAHQDIKHGCHLHAEWIGESRNLLVEEAGFTIQTAKETSGGKRYRVRIMFTGPQSYSRARQAADQLAFVLSAVVVETLRGASVSGGLAPSLMTASCLFKGSKLPVYRNGQLEMEAVKKIERIPGVFYNLSIPRSQNFFNADGILTHNSLFGFRGTNQKDFVQAAGTMPNLWIDTNYRSPPEITEAGDRLKFHNNTALKMAARAKAPSSPGAVGAWTYPNPETMGQAVVEDITAQAPEKNYTKRFAFIGRTNRELREVEDALVERGVPYFVKTRPFWRKESTLIVLGWLCAALKSKGGSVPSNIWDAVQRIRDFPNNKWREILSFNTIDSSTVEKLLDSVSKMKTTKTGQKTVLEVCTERDDYEGKIGQDPESGGQADQTSEDAEEEENLDSASVKRLKAFAKYAKITDPSELLQAASKFFVRDAEFDPFDYDEKNVLRQKKDEEAVNLNNCNCVSLMTIHASKGLEWDNTYVGFTNGRLPIRERVTDQYVLPGASKEESKEFVKEEERNMGYVAITRARKRMRAVVCEEGYFNAAGGPSPFLSEAGIPAAQDGPVIVPSETSEASEEDVEESYAMWLEDRAIMESNRA